MKEMFDSDSPVEPGYEDAYADYQDAAGVSSAHMKTTMKNSTHMRRIEIIRENKLLMSSIKDVYDY